MRSNDLCSHISHALVRFAAETYVSDTLEDESQRHGDDLLRVTGGIQVCPAENRMIGFVFSVVQVPVFTYEYING